MRFLMLDVDEYYMKASYGHYDYTDTFSSSIKDRWSLDEVPDVDVDLNLDKSFSKVSYGYYEYSYQISSYIKNIYVLKDSR